MKNRKALRATVTVCILLCIAGLAVLLYMSRRTHFNDGFVNGNLPGNLYNNGLFCESGDTIFFSNPADHHKLYAMDPDGSNVRKLCDDAAYSINADSNYVYYVRNNTGEDTAFSFLNYATNSLCRIDRDGGKITLLDDDPCLYASLIGNYIYYIHYDKEETSTLYRVKIDGSGREQVAEEPIKPCCAQGQYFYYNGVLSDHDLWRYDTDSGQVSAISSGIISQPTVEGNTIYYMDGALDYGITAYDTATRETRTVTTRRVDSFHVSGDYVYYVCSVGDEPGFYRCRTDGAGEERIASGLYTSIQVTSRYIYFYDYRDDTMCWRIPAEGAAEVSAFQP